MSDIERLRAELALAEAMEPLEKAREAMHADRSPANIKAYKKASDEAAAQRRAFREKHGSPGASGGDGVATPDMVKATGTAQAPR